MSSQTPTDNTRIDGLQQLVDYMAAGGKPRERWVVGTEHEKLGWWPDRGRPPTFEGPRGIGALLEGLAANNGWAATREGSDIIALARDKATITLEPGGQLELSGAPLRTLAETAAELDGHLAEIRAASAALGLEWSGLGYMPWRTPEEMPRMPKARYGIMRGYLPTRGGLAMGMMHSTCTVQANFDFADERDAMRKLRASLFLQPLVLAWFANSPVVKEADSGFATWRGQVWLDTDNDRFVYPPELLKPHATLTDYVEWALDVPMFFVHRDGRYVSRTGVSFRRFMESGCEGEAANVGDFALHLSTIFPDARLKQYLEVRGADMGDRAHVLALPALHVGLLYDEAALDATLDLFDGVDYETLWATRRLVPQAGLDAELAGRPLRKWAEDVLAIARGGLSRYEAPALPLLDVLEADLREGTQSDRIRARWDGDVAALMASARVC